MAEKSLLVVEPKAALVSPSDSFLPLGYLHVGKHPGGGSLTWRGYCRLTWLSYINVTMRDFWSSRARGQVTSGRICDDGRTKVCAVFLEA